MVLDEKKYIELMLLAVEGVGGFFSSSASGYCKGLTLLLLGQKPEVKYMKVNPWNNHYPLVGSPESEIQLAASGKKGLACGCTSFHCFGRVDTTGLESPSPGPTKSQEILPEPPYSHDDESKDQTHSVNPVNDDTDVTDTDEKVVSSLKISTNGVPYPVDVRKNDVYDVDCSLNKLESENSVSIDENGEGGTSRNIIENKMLYNKDDDCNDFACQVEGRKVQWMDATGGELFEIREFEMSDDSGDEFGYGNGTCSCKIM